LWGAIKSRNIALVALFKPMFQEVLNSARVESGEKRVERERKKKNKKAPAGSREKRRKKRKKSIMITLVNVGKQKTI
jgi:hypothetical protein